jgi:uncharacterized repeat protein (TIGR02543 family)
MENRYLEEWLRHYVGLGVDKIVIFDNNDTEGKYAENIFDLEYVKECKNKEIIDVYPIPGEKQAQTKSYNKCYEIYGENYDWLMFFDIDEFLMLEKHSTIQEFLAQPIFTPYEMIHINWKVYDDNDLVRVKDNDLYWIARNDIIYLLYDKKSYSVYYVTNSEYNIPTQNVKYGETVFMPTLAKDGYTFQGWYLDSSFKTAFSGNMPPYAITLYAKWEKNK